MGDALAAADAGGGETIAQAFATEFIQHGDDEARAGGAEADGRGRWRRRSRWFLSRFRAEFLFDGEVWRGEGFVHFHANRSARASSPQAACALRVDGTGPMP